MNRLAASQDDAFAQDNLDMMCDSGMAVEMDHTQAGKWYKLAAAKGFANVFRHLSVTYERRRGVEQNVAEALMLYRQAAGCRMPDAGCRRDSGT